jgi:hypothetical protein
MSYMILPQTAPAQEPEELTSSLGSGRVSEPRS